MFELGVILLIVGCLLRMHLTMSQRVATKELAPLTVRQRNTEIFLMKRERKRGFKDSWILIVAGIVLILFTGVFN